jgi:hypothetical protein
MNTLKGKLHYYANKNGSMPVIRSKYWKLALWLNRRVLIHCVFFGDQLPSVGFEK